MLRKIRPYILLAFLLVVACGFIAFVLEFQIKNTSDFGILMLWIGACIIGAVAIGVALSLVRRHTAEGPTVEFWSKHRTVTERLTNIPIDDMLRAERQFVLYGYTPGLSVALTVIMYRNQLPEDDICRIISPLIASGAQNRWLSPVKSRKKQIRQRGEMVKSIVSATEVVTVSQRGKKQPLSSSPVSGKTRSERNGAAGEAVRTIIEMYTAGHSGEDIANMLDIHSPTRRILLESQPANGGSR